MSRAGKRAWCLAFWVMGVPAGGLARAATIVPDLSTRELTAQADLIAAGTCTAVASRWLGRELVTLASFDVDETWKGRPRKSVRVVLPGGIDRRGPVPLAIDYGDAPSLTPGEQAVLFLKRVEQVAGGFVVVGYSQGKFSIRGGAGGKLACRNLAGTLLAQGSSLQPGAPTSVPLARLRAEVARDLAPASRAARPH